MWNNRSLTWEPRESFVDVGEDGTETVNATWDRFVKEDDRRCSWAHRTYEWVDFVRFTSPGNERKHTLPTTENKHELATILAKAHIRSHLPEGLGSCDDTNSQTTLLYRLGLYVLKSTIKQFPNLRILLQSLATGFKVMDLLIVYSLLALVLILAPTGCSKCGSELHIEFTNRYHGDLMQFRCRHCRNTLSIRTGSKFSHSNLSIAQQLHLMIDFLATAKGFCCF